MGDARKKRGSRVLKLRFFGTLNLNAGFWELEERSKELHTNSLLARSVSKGGRPRLACAAG
jgi:hypothetical protein